MALPSFVSAIFAHLHDQRMLAVALIGFLAGLTRGFSGFGSALVYVPLVSAAYSPHIGAATIFLVNFIFAAPFTAGAFTRCDWKTVRPLTLVASATVPLGAAILLLLDAITMRWVMAGMVAGALVLLLRGRRYEGTPGLPVTLGVGAVAGIMGGAAQMSGPPVVVFWLSSNAPAVTVRANFTVFFTLTALASGIIYYLQGLFTPVTLAVALVAGPTYFVGTAAGSHLFGLASERTFRVIAILIVALSALIGLPVFDPLYR